MEFTVIDNVRRYPSVLNHSEYSLSHYLPCYRKWAYAAKSIYGANKYSSFTSEYRCNKIHLNLVEYPIVVKLYTLGFDNQNI